MESGSNVSKWLGRTRVFAFFWAFALVAIANVITEESDIFLHGVDDYTDIILAIVALIIIAVWWKKQTPAELKRTNNVLTVLAAVLILATIFAITQESGDPTDFGNEIPTLLFGVFMLINRIV